MDNSVGTANKELAAMVTATGTYDPFADQLRFMRAVGQSTNVLNMEQMALYVKLIQEECNEELLPATQKLFAEMAANKPIHWQNIMEILDGCADTIVVVGGLIASLGVDPRELLKLVWASNLSKIPPGGVVLKREDGKVLKPPGYFPPNLAPLAQRVCGVE